MKQLKFLDVIKSKIQSCSTDYLFEVLIYFGSGFILGLIIKYSTKYILWLLFLGIAGFWLIQNFGLVTINQDSLKDVISIAQNYSISDIFDALIDVVNNHIGESLALILGFYLSWEIL